jgi:hypothetical protein
MKPLLHLTLNTGECFEQVRGDVNDDALAALTPLISRRGGLLPAPFGTFRVEITERIDSAGLLFSVIRGADPIVTCGLCWDIRAARLIWGMVNGLSPRTSQRGGCREDLIYRGRGEVPVVSGRKIDARAISL